jgi:hypothetical protein
MDTLVMLDLTPGDDCSAELKVLVEGQLALKCPEEKFLVTTYAPGCIAEDFVDMVQEVEERAHLAMTTRSTLERGIVRCGYVALRNMTFLLHGHDPYELGALLMVFRTSNRVVRRFAVPDLEEDTPAHVRQMLAREILEAREALPHASGEEGELRLADKIANAVIDGFADYAHYLALSRPNA